VGASREPHHGTATNLKASKKIRLRQEAPRTPRSTERWSPARDSRGQLECCTRDASGTVKVRSAACSAVDQSGGSHWRISLRAARASKETTCGGCFNDRLPAIVQLIDHAAVWPRPNGCAVAGNLPRANQHEARIRPHEASGGACGGRARQRAAGSASIGTCESDARQLTGCGNGVVRKPDGQNT
jgi:hypothetical protein